MWIKRVGITLPNKAPGRSLAGVSKQSTVISLPFDADESRNVLLGEQ